MTEQLNFLFHLLAVWPEVAYLASLRLTCLISMMGLITTYLSSSCKDDTLPFSHHRIQHIIGAL